MAWFQLQSRAPNEKDNACKTLQGQPLIRVSTSPWLTLNNQTERAQRRAVRVNYLLHTAKVEEWNALPCSQHHHEYLGISWIQQEALGTELHSGGHRAPLFCLRRSMQRSETLQADPCGNSPVQLHCDCFQPDWKLLLCHPCVLLSGSW